MIASTCRLEFKDIIAAPRQVVQFLQRPADSVASPTRTVVRSAQVQEQTQIIATAIGKPAAKAPTIIKVNAKSGFASGRALSTDMSLTPPRG